MATFIEDLGIVSAYGEAVRKGYTGTEEEFAEMLANLPDKLAEAREYAASAAESSASAASSADGVQRNASIASTAASDAQSAAASALQSATFAETTVDGIEEHEEQCRIYRAEAVAAAEELKTTTLWNDALIDETVTGKIASFDDGCAGMPMKSIVAEITPVQEGSGDPSPTNIRPISGRTGLTVTRSGKNLLKLPYRDTNGTRNGITFTTHADGSVTINGTASPAVSGTVFATAESDLPLNVGDVLYFSAGQTYNENSAYMRLLYADNYSGIGRITTENFALTLTAAIIERGLVFQIWVPNGVTVNNMTFKPIMSKASIEEWQSPTVNQTISITWESIAGTVYGGTLDVVSGVLTVDKTISNVTSTDGISTVGSAGHGFLISRSTGIEPKNTESNYATGVFSDKFPASVAASSLATNAIFVDNYGRIRFNTEAQYSSVSAMFSAVGSFSIVYPVETPQTYQLTPTEVRTILGENLVYSDADNVTVNYYVDMKGYIDKRLNTTRMMIAGVETSFVATKNYAIGDFVIVNDTLYRITAVITSGETITPGTNASETTVAEQLIALYNA